MTNKEEKQICKLSNEQKDEVDLSNYEWCSITNSYMDNEYCKNTGCEKCSFYLDS